MKNYNLKEINNKNIAPNYCLNILMQSKNIIKELLYGYHSSILLFIKKQSKQWGIDTKFVYKSMSDNIHYVNLIPNQHESGSKVGNYSYFARLLRDIPTCTPYLRGESRILSKKLKSLICNSFMEKILKKGLDLIIVLCKLNNGVRINYV
jgi:hypothetical protein